MHDMLMLCYIIIFQLILLIIFPNIGFITYMKVIIVVTPILVDSFTI